jgi:hypothetical protein
VCLRFNCGVRPGKQAQLQQCLQQIYQPQVNTDIACKLYAQGGFGRWSYSAKECGL